MHPLLKGLGGAAPVQEFPLGFSLVGEIWGVSLSSFPVVSGARGRPVRSPIFRHWLHRAHSCVNWLLSLFLFWSQYPRRGRRFHHAAVAHRGNLIFFFLTIVLHWSNRIIISIYLFTLPFNFFTFTLSQGKRPLYDENALPCTLA